MSARLIKLLTASFLFFCLGIALFPALFPTKAERKVTKTVHKAAPVIVRETNVDDWSRDDEEVDDTDTEWVEAPEEDTQPDRRVARQDEETFDEDDVPLDARQNVVPEARVHAQFTTIMGAFRRFTDTLAKQEKENFINTEFKGDDWADPEKIYFSLADRIISKLGKLSDAAILEYMEDPANRLDLARVMLIRKTGSQGIRGVTTRPKGKALMAALTSDLN